MRGTGPGDGHPGTPTAPQVEASRELPGVWLVRLAPRPDPRGRLVETYRASWLPFAPPMVQANRSDSVPGVLRGLHFHHRQADLWVVHAGRVSTVLVDVRRGSPAFGQHTVLRQGGGAEVAVYIPPGVAHGFYAHDSVTMSYLVSTEYDGSDELGIAWDDPSLAIAWPDRSPVLSARDRANPRLAEVGPDELVGYAE